MVFPCMALCALWRSRRGVNQRLNGERRGGEGEGGGARWPLWPGEESSSVEREGGSSESSQCIYCGLSRSLVGAVGGGQWGGVLYVVYGLIYVQEGGEWRGRREQEIVYK